MKKATPSRPVKKVRPALSAKELTAKVFVEELFKYKSPSELKKFEKFFHFDKQHPLKDDEFVGVRMGQVFAVAKGFMDMKPSEVEKLMDHKVHEVRAGAMSIMGKKGAHRKTSPEELKALYDLYLRRHDRINSWDLVDLAAHHVVGRYLAEKPRAILYKLAKSKNLWERRTALVATAHFILKLKQTEDTFLISELLLDDKEEFVNTASGWMLRAAGTVDKKKLVDFLDKYAADMPRVTLRAALEHFDKKHREYYLNLKNKN